MGHATISLCTIHFHFNFDRQHEYFPSHVSGRRIVYIQTPRKQFSVQRTPPPCPNSPKGLLEIPNLIVPQTYTCCLLIFLGGLLNVHNCIRLARGRGLVDIHRGLPEIQDALRANSLEHGAITAGLTIFKLPFFQKSVLEHNQILCEDFQNI